MLIITKLNKQKMDLTNILKYIEENSPKKIKNEEAKNILDDKQTVVGREYIVKDKYDIKEMFIITLDNNETYLTHTIENPHQELELEDDF